MIMRTEAELPFAPAAHTIKEAGGESCGSLEEIVEEIGQASVADGCRGCREILRVESNSQIRQVPMSLAARALVNYADFKGKEVSWDLLKEMQESSAGIQGWANAFAPSPSLVEAAVQEIRRGERGPGTYAFGP